MTSLDFKALMAKERAKLRASASASGSAGASSTAGGTASFAQGKGGDGEEESGLLGPRREKVDLARFAVPGPVGGVAYVPGWLTAAEADNLLAAIDRAPSSAWTNLHNRRLQNLGGVPDSVGGMRPVPIPPYAAAVFRALVQAGVFPEESPPNHVLLNEYRRGQGIAAHKDGVLYHPTVAIVSLGSPATLEFWPTSDPVAGPAAAAVELGHRSLLVFQGEAYLDYWHGILRREEEEEQEGGEGGSRRVSLTVRRVLHVRDPEASELLETSESLWEEKRKEARFLMSITDDRPDLT